MYQLTRGQNLERSNATYNQIYIYFHANRDAESMRTNQHTKQQMKKQVSNALPYLVMLSNRRHHKRKGRSS